MILGHIGRQVLINTSRYSTSTIEGAVFGTLPDCGATVHQIPDRHLLCVAWGRLDNTSELQSWFPSAKVDTDFLLAAYSKWGEDFPEHVRGDWGFACFNSETQELFLTRDQNSNLPLFFVVNHENLVFSSSLEPLLALRKEFNPRFALGILTLWKYGIGDETIFEGIRKVPPGHKLKFQKGSVHLQRYWHLDQIQPSSYSNVNDYSDELLELTWEAIRCRMPTSNRVASMLSGGLDSSTVSVLASQQIESLTTYSHVPLHPDPSFQSKNKFYDESPYIDKIASSWPNIRSKKLQSEHISPISGIEDYVSTFNTIMHGAQNAFWMMDIFRSASEDGFDVLLSGKQGNAGLSYKGLKEMLPQKRTTKGRIKKAAKTWLKNAIEYRTFLRINNRGYVREEALREYGVKLDVLIHRTGVKSTFGSIQEDISNLLKISHRYAPVDSENVFHSKILDPTSDSRIIEFCASIPNHVFFNEKGENKQVLRRMMHRLLPDEVLNEKKKGLQAADISQRIKADLPRIEAYTAEFVKNPAFCHLIDEKKFQRDVARLSNGQDVYLTGLLKAIMLGIFLQKHGF